ncbi:phosphopentomutase [Patulibacter sp. SYSU D01012]|uniref:phosphopentomutase n=1 Tax=Patulibacter sp. SYSU D01012 TaxID=2817381 RepID=UPI001B30510F
MPRRAFVLVLDACGVGALPDAGDYGDEGADTLGHLAQLVGGLDLPALGGLGLGAIAPIAGVPPAARPAIHGRLDALGPGKDSIVGHWGLMGVAAPGALPTWPAGVGEDERRAMGELAGTPLLSGATSDGLDALATWGAEHLRTGHPILYTSAVDSVLQLAAHERHWPVPALHDLAVRLHAALPADRRPARIIARPFVGEPGAFVRIPGRKDVAMAPPAQSYLDALQDRGVPVHGVGKVVDVFAGRGFDVVHPATTNAEALAATETLLDGMDRGLAFVNLVETDDRFGHRKDTAGFHGALRAIDAAVGGWLPRLGPDDLLVLTADHGVDPAAPHPFHTREYAPLLAHVRGPDGRPLSGRRDGTLADVGASALAWLTGASPGPLPGRSFVP